jgi:hypothetical protein
MHRLFLVAVSLIACLLVSACSTARDGHVILSVSVTPSGEKIQTSIENTWTPNARAIAEKIYTGAWEYYDQRAGGSILVRLSRHDHMVGSFDGNAYFRIAFQLPADISVGKTVKLHAIPPGRKTRKAPHDYNIAEMEDGEITASKFGNPMMGWMKRAEVASVKVLSLDAKQAVIHLKLKAALDPKFDFDFDQTFTLAVTPVKH